MAFALLWTGMMANGADDESAFRRVRSRDYPSVFQALNPIDMQAFPLNTLQERLRAAAKHDVLWEEPITQLGSGADLALGTVWDGEYPGLATQFTEESLQQALTNRAAMLEFNPAMIFLLEVRWRDAPAKFLPEDSPFWQRDAEGKRVVGWDGGSEPYYLLDPENGEFADSVARQCLAAVESGVYDGVMFDWSGHLPIVVKVREALGDEPIIVVNIHDDIIDGMKYRHYINGSFMELNPVGPGRPSSQLKSDWAEVRKALLWFEKNFQVPQVNCLEVWGDRGDERRMRATTTLGLTHSNGSVLYADPKSLKTPDHLHDWYEFWDAPLGSPTSRLIERSDKSYQREFQGGTVIYNPSRNGPVRVEFATNRRRMSDGESGKDYIVMDGDGDIFLKVQ